MPRSYSERLQHIVGLYIEDGQEWPATSKQIAAWAITNDHWKPQPSAILNQCAEHISRAMREEYITDPQGRTVRAKHAARIKQEGHQMVLWADSRTATHEHMETALKQRRSMIVGDCRQLKNDMDSYNDNREPEKPIQIIFDFTDDLAELEAADGLDDTDNLEGMDDVAD